MDFPSEPIGRWGGRVLVIGVPLGVESSKQPRSTAAGRARDARCSGPRPEPGRPLRQKEPAAGRRPRAPQKSRHKWAPFRSPGRELLTCIPPSFLFSGKPKRFCFHNSRSPFSSYNLKTPKRERARADSLDSPSSPSLHSVYFCLCGSDFKPWY